MPREQLLDLAVGLTVSLDPARVLPRVLVFRLALPLRWSAKPVTWRSGKLLWFPP